MNECYECDFWDSDREGCTCPHSDRWYACPVESELPENKKAIEEYAEWAGKQWKENDEECPTKQDSN